MSVEFIDHGSTSGLQWHGDALLNYASTSGQEPAALSIGKSTEWLQLRSFDIAQRGSLQTVLSDLKQYDRPNWDGEDAHPIGATSVGIVRDLLRDLIALNLSLPHTAPACDGSACMEWSFHRGDQEAEIFIDIGPERKIMTFLKDFDGTTVEQHFPSYSAASKLHILQMFDKLMEQIAG